MAIKGNQFWKLRLKHGRNCAIETSEELWQNFEEYAQWCEENPLKEEQLIKTKVSRDSENVDAYTLSKMRPMHKDSFALACGLSGWEVISGYKTRGSDFVEVIARIEKYIFNQKLDGASCGFFNANIISADLGLIAKSQQTVIQEQPLFPDAE